MSTPDFDTKFVAETLPNGKKMRFAVYTSPRTVLPVCPRIVMPTHFVVKNGLSAHDVKYKINAVLAEHEDRGLVWEYNTISVVWNCSYLQGSIHGSFRISAFCDTKNDSMIVEVQKYTGDGSFFGTIFGDLQTQLSDKNAFDKWHAPLPKKTPTTDDAAAEDTTAEAAVPPMPNAGVLTDAEDHITEADRRKSREYILGTAIYRLRSRLREHQLEGAQLACQIADEFQHYAAIFCDMEINNERHIITDLIDIAIGAPTDDEDKPNKFGKRAAPWATSAADINETNADTKSNIPRIDWAAAHALIALAKFTPDTNTTHVFQHPNANTFLQLIAHHANKDLINTYRVNARAPGHSMHFDEVGMQANTFTNACSTILCTLVLNNAEHTINFIPKDTLHTIFSRMEHHHINNYLRIDAFEQLKPLL